MENFILRLQNGKHSSRNVIKLWNIVNIHCSYGFLKYIKMTINELWELILVSLDPMFLLLDILKDSIILIKIIASFGGMVFIYKNPTTFSSAVIF